ncbi:MAG: DNA adenine methylase [Desulfobacteraceae bacterium]|nr:DNA adenine methylase [Desulfobacteraceae bacterium]
MVFTIMFWIRHHNLLNLLSTTREIFEDWKRQQEAGGLTDIQKAARYYYLQRLCFSGRVKNRNFGVTVDRYPRINLMRLEEKLSEVHLRMSKVTVENLTYQNFIPRYDRKGTFFYIDPPYYKAPYYKHNLLELSEFEEMAPILKKCKGQFILSINDVPEIRKAFNKFKIKPIKLTYTAPSGKGTVGKELLISNF